MYFIYTNGGTSLIRPNRSEVGHEHLHVNLIPVKRNVN